MKCVYCHSDDITIRDVKEEIAIGNDIALVDVQTPVCGGCGERYYDRSTMRRLEQIERDLKEHRTKVRQIGKVLAIA